MSDKMGRAGDQRAVSPHLDKAIAAEGRKRQELFAALAAYDARKEKS